MMAHVNEHLGFEYRKQIEKQLGMPLPAQFDESGEEDHMSPEIEARLSPLLAQAAQQLLQSNQSQEAQQKAQQQAQDPLVQMQQQELQLKAQEIKIKEQKLKIDAAAKEDQMEIERDRISSQERIAGAQIGAKVQADKMRSSAEQQAEGLRIGVDIAKHKSQMSSNNLKQDFLNQQPTKGSE
jgi:CRISPR/Cas system-associated endonuclease/helicase Cas3